jgi:predicted enzyme related to lactoylglutathione lyase
MEAFMIAGSHVIVYTRDAEADRAFFRDVLRLPAVDSGDGWLIFALPPAEVALHPADGNDAHQLWLACDDLEATMRELRERGAVLERPREESWGSRTALRLPGGGWLGLYQPRHALARGPAGAGAGAWRAAPILGARDVRRAAEHYRDVLGFRLDPARGVFQPSADEPGGVYAIVERDGALVHLQVRRDAPPRPARAPHERDAYLYVRDLDALHRALVERGANVVDPPRTMPYGLRELVVEDLDGNRIAFGEIVP